MPSRHTEWKSVSRLIAFTMGAAFLIWVLWGQLGRMQRGAPGATRDQAVCFGGKLGTPAAREKAKQDGYAIEAQLDCITRASYDARQQAEVRLAAERQETATAQALAEQRRAAQTVVDAGRTLTEARQGFKTAVALSDLRRTPLPEPPPKLYVRSDYESAGRTLAAFITPNLKDARKYPAVIWLTGGDTNTLGDFWVRGEPGNDQSAQAFREAGLVVMFPTLRGGNTNPGAKELGMGEVDDVLAAADHLANQPHVDPAQIYLGGHSTGGTLALLVAQRSKRFAAVLALGPVGDVRDYGPDYGNGIRWNSLLNAEDEMQLRSPGHWMTSIRSPTFVIEGKQSPSNLRSLSAMCEHAERIPALRCLEVPGYDHFSIVQPVAKAAAAQMLVAGPSSFRLSVDQLKRPEILPAR
ncbi:MAG: prolyl oligopeptidase family serine peptidase [Ottowia sp.]|nr:prolyl oligopeptidase family serine peptidase [Ottowia sp.]